MVPITREKLHYVVPKSHAVTWKNGESGFHNGPAG
jgi:hypothetical protein